MNKKHKMRMNWTDRIFMCAVYLFLAFFFFITLYPMVFVLSASFSDPDMVASGEMLLLPVGFNLQAYQYILRFKDIWVGYANTIFYTVVGTLLNLLVTLPAAYALSRRDLKGRKFFMIMFMITMYFSGGLIPGYLNIKSFGLLNTRMVLLVSGLVSVYNMIVARTFFHNTIPWELHEAASLDGASDTQTFTQIVLPLSKPIMAVMLLYYGVAHWNSYFSAMIYLRDRTKFPLQLFLREILLEAQSIMAGVEEAVSAEEISALMKQAEVANQIKYAIIVVSTVPMLIIYPKLEKYFAKGVMIGSVKG